MTIINSSYEVLSDGAKRRAHDLWIAEQERGAGEAEAARTGQTASQTSQHPQSSSPARGLQVLSHFGRYWFWYLAGGFAFYAGFLDKPSAPPPGPKPYQASPPAPPRSAWIRPESAPNGQPWPATAAYIKGYQRLHTSGLSTVTVDNSKNDSDVFVKLVSLEGSQAYPVRQFFIPAYGAFTVTKVDAGRYDVRYRDLISGGLSRSEAFELEEIPTQAGTQYSTITMTLYKVQHGNMQTYRLSESEF